MLAPGGWAVSMPAPSKRSYDFRPYQPGKTFGTVTCVTPRDGPYLHTFYDVCPFSPSQRYLAVTKFPYQGRKPVLGDIAEVCVIDLHEQTIEAVYASRAWSFQLGANVQWGNGSDRYLYANDVLEDGQVVAVRLDLQTREVRLYSGAKYDLAPDDSFIISGNLTYITATQYGYGIPDPAGSMAPTMRPEAIDREGLWRTDLETDETRLLVSYRDFAAKLTDPKFFEGGTFYCFHSKINSSGTRLMQVIRCLIPDKNKGGRNASLFSLNADGSDIREIVDRVSWQEKGDLGRRGNHPNWHPDGEHIVMNLIPRSRGYKNIRFCQFKSDGSEFQILSDKHLGSGHPSVDGTAQYLLSDAYPSEPWAQTENGHMKIRLIHLSTDEEVMICSASVDLGTSRSASNVRQTGGSHFKLDPHPAWGRDYKRVCFNGVEDGLRQVYVADLSGVL